jgi:protein-L-isoaspartate(D-aspartate) O-methyltransferase
MHRILFSLSLLLAVSCSGQPSDQTDWKKQRTDLVEVFVKGQGISDGRVLAAMQKVERHLFVPEEYRSMAYWDRPLPIGEGQTISQPSLVAMMTEILELERSDKVLEIGTGSGYQAAILGELVDSVFTIEIIQTLGERSSRLLKDLGYTNIYVKTGDGYKGWPEHAPYDAIIVTCAPSAIPEPLQDQLAEGGRMIIPVGEENTVQELVLIRKKRGRLAQENIIPVRFVPMLREDGKTY